MNGLLFPIHIRLGDFVCWSGFSTMWEVGWVVTLRMTRQCNNKYHNNFYLREIKIVSGGRLLVELQS